MTVAERRRPFSNFFFKAQAVLLESQKMDAVLMSRMPFS
jgi:hypothetical protein